MSTAELLTLLAERARELREAGVRRLQTNEFQLELAPHETPPELSPPREEEILDPLKDPSTFPGGRIPQFFRRVNE